MGNLNMDKLSNKTFADGREISLISNEFKVLWLLASQPKKSFSSNDIIDAIMASGIMLHEKQFVEMIASNICKKASVPFIQKTTEDQFRFRNKFMND